jgi:hypothetical protein
VSFRETEQNLARVGVIGSKLHINQVPQVERIVFRIGLAAAEILISEGIL